MPPATIQINRAPVLTLWAAVVAGVLGFNPGPVDRYLRGKFGDPLDSAREAMEVLAESVGAEQLPERAFKLYETFRPQIPACNSDWPHAGCPFEAGKSKGLHPTIVPRQWEKRR